ncbi:NADH dehydrogenase [uncultured Leptolyngbya sp.]|uniref:NADH dehydrogenase n=1 Tax=uncultured Leptolyngbya sp. TaxID=332963 RepID=A0A6J4NK58_9CYAN|nr:NADH dehydrogenase [uncultured Leptolyngbya sp.]
MTIDLQPTTGLKDSIEQRRAARAFLPDRIPEVIVEQILHLGLRSPSGYNLQPWRFVVLREQQSKETLQSCAFNQTQIAQAPVVLLCCGDRTASSSDNIEAVIKLGQANNAMPETFAEYMRSQIPPFFEHHPSFESLETWTNRHTMLAVAHLMIVAKSFGVDSCPMEGFVSAQVKTAFNIPDTVDVCCILCLGYANEPFKAFGGRFSPEQVCFGETYGAAFSL